MKISNLKNYLSLNILSAVGYPSIVFWIWGIYERIQYITLEHSTGQDSLASYYFVYILIMALFYNIVGVVILILLSIIEKFIQKKYPDLKDFKISFLGGRAHSILFWIGIIFSLFPFAFAAIWYLATLYS